MNTHKWQLILFNKLLHPLGAIFFVFHYRVWGNLLKRSDSMIELTCVATHCINNIGGFCTARVISVNGILAGEAEDTQCGTFGEKTLTKAIKNMVNLNIGAALEQSLTTDHIVISPDVICDAEKCRFNNNRRCVSQNIVMSAVELNPSKGPYCGSFEGLSLKYSNK